VVGSVAVGLARHSPVPLIFRGDHLVRSRRAGAHSLP
jgi:hypothetical protein